MKRLERAAIITALARSMDDKGSWCGETHLQKATYFLQNLLKVPMAYEFILYKHGPFSFDLHDELTELRADGLLDLVPQPLPYGPKLLPTDAAERLWKRLPKALDQYRPRIAFVAGKLAHMGAVELERVGTALLVSLEFGFDKPVEQRAKEISRLKPHVGQEEAQSALEELDVIREEAEALLCKE